MNFVTNAAKYSRPPICKAEWKERFIVQFASRLSDSNSFIDASLTWNKDEARREAEQEYAEKGACYQEHFFAADPEGAADDALLYGSDEPYIL